MFRLVITLGIQGETINPIQTEEEGYNGASGGGVNNIEFTSYYFLKSIKAKRFPSDPVKYFTGGGKNNSEKVLTCVYKQFMTFITNTRPSPHFRL